VSHSETRARLSEYLERDLPPEQRVGVDAHLAECGECRRELEELRAMVALLRGLPEPELPAGIADAALARIAQGETRVLRLLRRATEPRFVAPLAAGLAGLFLLLEAGDRTPAPPASPLAALVPSAGPEAARRSDLTLVLGGVGDPGERSMARAGVVSGATSEQAFAQARNAAAEISALRASRQWQAALAARGPKWMALRHGAAQGADADGVARLLRGVGHPHSSVFATHFAERPTVVTADWQPR
jgi:anti-sigma factor RsiW